MSRERFVKFFLFYSTDQPIATPNIPTPPLDNTIQKKVDKVDSGIITSPILHKANETGGWGDYFNFIRGVTITKTATRLITETIHDPKRVVTFSIKHCLPTHMPFNLQRCPNLGEESETSQTAPIVNLDPVPSIPQIITTAIPDQNYYVNPEGNKNQLDLTPTIGKPVEQGFGNNNYNPIGKPGKEEQGFGNNNYNPAVGKPGKEEQGFGNNNYNPTVGKPSIESGNQLNPVKDNKPGNYGKPVDYKENYQVVNNVNRITPDKDKLKKPGFNYGRTVDESPDNTLGTSTK